MIFSSLKKTRTSRIPNFRTSQKVMMLTMAASAMDRIIPSTTPKAYPAAISKGSPGMAAITTWKMTIPAKISRARQPFASTQTRNAAGSEMKLTMGVPTNFQITTLKIRTAAIRPAAIHRFFRLLLSIEPSSENRTVKPCYHSAKRAGSQQYAEKLNGKFMKAKSFYRKV